MPEFAERHHLHDGAHGIGLTATDDLARHHGVDRFVEHRGASFAERAHDVALRQNPFHACLAHHEHGADPALAQDLDRSGKFCVRPDALDLMTFGIKDRSYRHGRLLKPVASRKARSIRETPITRGLGKHICRAAAGFILPRGVGE